MTLEPMAQVATVEPGAMGDRRRRKAAAADDSRGPVAAVIPIKQLGTNGGGFFGANSAHPFENPDATDQFLECCESS